MLGFVPQPNLRHYPELTHMDPLSINSDILFRGDGRVGSPHGENLFNKVNKGACFKLVKVFNKTMPVFYPVAQAIGYGVYCVGKHLVALSIGDL